MNKRFKKTLKTIFVFTLIFSWVFSGWPNIWNNPQFPPKIQETRAATLSLYVDSLDSAVWTTVGVSPYLDIQDQPTNYIHSVGRNTGSGEYGFTDTVVTGTINSVTLYIYAYGVASTNFTTFLNATPTGLGPPASWGWVNVDVSTILTTWDAINAATVSFDRPNTKDDAGVDTAYLYVDYNVPPTLSISQPDGDSDTVTVGDLYDITYTLVDADNTVTAAFSYDTDNTGLDGTAITGACATAAEGSGVTCSWDTTGMTPGNYYVYGITNDGVNPQVSAYSLGQITINAAGFSPSIEIRAQNYTTLVSNITFSEGDLGTTVSQPYNNVDTGSPQAFGDPGTPVVTLYNGNASTLTIWYNITTFTNGVVSNEYYFINTKGAACADATVINNVVTFDVDTSTGITIAAGAGNEKDFYLKTILSSLSGKSGTSTLTILGEAL